MSRREEVKKLRRTSLKVEVEVEERSRWMLDGWRRVVVVVVDKERKEQQYWR